jgi:hypothetical protein
MWQEIDPILARLIVSRDPAGYFAIVYALAGIQTLVWAIARDNVDIEWWRALALAFIAVVVGGMAVAAGLSVGALGAILGCAFAIWLICGWLYDGLEIWQRVTLSLGGAVIGSIAMLLGIVTRNLIVSNAAG